MTRLRSVLPMMLFALLMHKAAFAQITYTSDVPFTCNTVNPPLVMSLQSFACGGSVVEKDSADASLEYQFSGPGKYVQYVPSRIFQCQDAGGVWHQSSWTQTKFTEPASGADGTYGFDWSGYADNPDGSCGAFKHGSASGTWNFGPPHRGGSSIILTTHSTTVAQ